MVLKCIPKLSGVAEYLAENDADGIRIAREIFEHLNWKEQTKSLDQDYKEPRYSAEELLGIIPQDPEATFGYERNRGSGLLMIQIFRI